MNSWTDRLHDSVLRGAGECDAKASDLRKIATLLSAHAQNPNAPTEVAKQLLNRFGFCVLHREQMLGLLAIAAMHLTGDFESDAEEERAKALERAIQDELSTVRA